MPYPALPIRPLWTFRISIARALFKDWERSSVHLTCRPVGTCLMRTAVSTFTNNKTATVTVRNNFGREWLSA